MIEQATNQLLNRHDFLNIRVRAWGNHFRLVQKPVHGEDVELLTVKIDFYFLRGSADVTLQPQLAQTEDASLLAMFSCYLAVMAYEDMASSGTL